MHLYNLNDIFIYKIMKFILNDIFFGFLHSIQIFLFTVNLNKKILKLIIKVLIYNIFIYMIQKIEYYIITIPLIIFNILFHTLHYIDLINIINKNKSLKNSIDSISISITLGIFQTVIYLLIILINLIFNDRFKILKIIINYFILTFYHSFYCYNNLWQSKGIDMVYRLDIFQKLWPYFIGYGSIASIIYINMGQINIFYNMYMILIITIPFLEKARYPKDEKYPKLNIDIIYFLIKIIHKLSKIKSSFK